jgi:hypothetical protein
MRDLIKLEKELEKDNLQLRDLIARMLIGKLGENTEIITPVGSDGAAIGFKRLWYPDDRINLHVNICKNIDKLIDFLKEETKCTKKHD